MKTKNILIFSFLFLMMPFFAGVQTVKADTCNGKADGTSCDVMKGTHATAGKCQSGACVITVVEAVFENTGGAPAVDACNKCLSENTPAQCFEAELCQNVESTLPAGGPVAKKDLNSIGTSFFDSLFGGGASTTDFTATAPKCGPGFDEVAGVCMPGKGLTGLSDVGVLDILSSLLSWLFALFSILSIMAFIVSGIQYLTSAGSTDMIETAKRNATWSLVGILVGLSGYIILKAVSTALSGNPIF